jgi:hypothetical protein
MAPRKSEKVKKTWDHVTGQSGDQDEGGEYWQNLGGKLCCANVGSRDVRAGNRRSSHNESMNNNDNSQLSTLGETGYENPIFITKSLPHIFPSILTNHPRLSPYFVGETNHPRSSILHILQLPAERHQRHWA